MKKKSSSSGSESKPLTTALIISRALELGIPISDLDLIDVDFLIELIEQRNIDLDNKDEVEEATPEIMKSFF